MMIDTTLYLSFILISLGLIIIPGPNILAIISTTIAHGRKHGLQTVVGTSSAMALQLLIVAFGTAMFVQLVAEGFILLKWLGVVYLLYLGLVHLKQALNNSEGIAPPSASATILRGFIVSLTNPKTLLFFAAFLPQFVSADSDYLSQVAILSITFLLLATMIDCGYAIFASKAAGFLQGRGSVRIQHGASGALYLGAGAWLAALKRIPP